VLDKLLQTAYIERINLTVRQSVAALTRRTWATAQTAAGLQRQLALGSQPHVLAARLHDYCAMVEAAAGKCTLRVT